jgi:hypothetical protein
VLDDLARRGLPASGANSFGFLLIDGLSVQEEIVVAAIHMRLGGISLFGGSAADNADFRATHVYANGRFHTNAAIFSLLHTSAPFRVLKTQHFIPTDVKMVVTQAEPATRRVIEINGLPAAREYARLVGLDHTALTPTVFATHPVVVRLGGDDYVRSIMHANEDGSITFACAIDEGIVLTVAQPTDIVADLERLFADLRAEIGPPQIIFGCDCLFRSIEMDQRGLRDAISRLFRENNVVGFSAYGEQYNAMHVNQTFTGVAIGAPRAA